MVVPDIMIDLSPSNNPVNSFSRKNSFLLKYSTYLTYSLNVGAVLRCEVTARLTTLEGFLPKPTVGAEPIFYPFDRMPKMSI